MCKNENQNPMEPACAACRWHKGTCWPGQCLLYRAKLAETLYAALSALMRSYDDDAEEGAKVEHDVEMLLNDCGKHFRWKGEVPRGPASENE